LIFELREGVKGVLADPALDAPAASIMEQSEGNDVSSVSNKVEVSPKSKQKKKSLCRMLMNKKTKVGCLESSYKDGDSNKNSKIENSHHGSQTSTKLSLCCAMTERSRTPPQSLTVSRLSPTTLSRTSVKSEIASINEDRQTDVLVEREEMPVANNQAQALQETVVRRSNIVGKEQRPSTYIEGKLGNICYKN